MNRFKYFLILGSFFLGLILFLVHKKYLIFFNRFDYFLYDSDKFIKKQKSVKIYYFFENQLQFKIVKFFFDNSNIDFNIKQVILSWLKLLKEEEFLKSNVYLKFVFLNKSHKQLFLSFNENFFNENCSIFERIYIIESLLKTLKDSFGKEIINLRLMVKNNKFKDDFLSFGAALNLSGFSNIEF